MRILSPRQRSNIAVGGGGPGDSGESSGGFPRQALRLPRLAQKNETMGTRGTHGTNYLSQGIKELQRASRLLNVSRETFWRSFQEIICLIPPTRLTGLVPTRYARPCPASMRQ